MPANPTPDARPYIDHLDGIRCLAVVLVVLFHTKLPGLSGGFVGVDVFFVLSGFLMTRILCGSTLDAAGLRTFFAGRARRILPACLAMLAVCAVVSAALLLPIHVKGMAASLASAPLFLSNFVFWQTTNYFSQDLAYNPLLHTWSLAVEWQFYLLYPLLFVALRRRRGLIPAAVLLCGLLSYALAHALVASSHTIASFYLLPTRTWEFIVGGLLVFLPPWRGRPWVGQCLGVLGLAMVLACALRYTSRTPFPGAAAVLPCVGAALLVHAGGAPGPLNRLLTWRPVARIGQWSYSIYLWHWPLIVFCGYAFAPGHFDGRPAFVVAISAASVLLGAWSWRYIEAPFRTAGHRPAHVAPALRPLRAGVAASALCMAVAAAMHVSDGLPFRFSPEVAALSNAHDDAGAFRHCLSRTPGEAGQVDDLCRLGAASAPVTFLMLGDSHGAALAHGISDVASAAGQGGLLSVSDACAPLLDFPGNYPPSRARCERAQRAIPSLVDAVRPDVIVLHAVWSAYHRRDPARFERVLAQTLDAFVGRAGQVVIVGDTPGARGNVPLHLAKAAAFGTRSDIAFSAEEVERREAATRALLKGEAARRSFTYVDLNERLCDGARCRLVVDGLPLYWDSTHLTGRGATHVARLLGERLFVHTARLNDTAR